MSTFFSASDKQVRFIEELCGDLFEDSSACHKALDLNEGDDLKEYLSKLEASEIIEALLEAQAEGDVVDLREIIDELRS